MYCGLCAVVHSGCEKYFVLFYSDNTINCLGVFKIELSYLYFRSLQFTCDKIVTFNIYYFDANCGSLAIFQTKQSKSHQ